MALKLDSFAILILSFLASIILSYALCRALIFIQKKRKVSQPIHALGVKEHQKKAGTPTLGGVAILLSVSILLLSCAYYWLHDPRLITIILASGGFFAVGLLDDLLKIIKKNEQGAGALLRLGIEVAIVLVALKALNYDEAYMWKITFYPFEFRAFVGIILLFILIFAVVGSANSSNLMDGLDGLDGGTIMIAFLPIMIMALKEKYFGLAFLLILCIGSIIGFLILNSHPAKIFMGDSGSLFLGALLAWSLIYMDRLVLLPLIGLLYVIESLSVILQVMYYKATKRRIFLMAPLHHHFELKAIPEYRVVMGYFLVQCAISVIVIVTEVIL